MDIKKGEIVYFDNFKFGIVISTFSSYAIIYFPLEKRPYNFPLKNIDSLNNKEIVDKLTIYDVFHLSLLDYFFESKIISRAKSYANPQTIKLLSDNEHEVEASILGTDSYYTSISFYNNVIAFSCTCPYEKDCKHLYALILFIKQKHKISNFIKYVNQGYLTLQDTLNEMDSLSIFSSHNKNKNLENENKYFKKTKEFIKDINKLNNKIKIYQEIEKFIELNNDLEIIDLIKFIYNENNSFYFKSNDSVLTLKYFASYNKDVLEIINQNIKNTNDKELSLIKEKLYPLNDIDITLEKHNLNNSLLYSLFNNNYKKLQLVIDEMSNFKFQLKDFYVPFLYYSLQFININENNFDYLLDISNSSSLVILYSSLKDEIYKNRVLAKLIKEKNFDYKDYLEYFDLKTIKKLFDLSLYNETTLNLISSFAKKLIEQDEILFLLKKFYEVFTSFNGFASYDARTKLYFLLSGKNPYLSFLLDSYNKDADDFEIKSLKRYFNNIKAFELPKSFDDYFEVNYEISDGIFHIYAKIKTSEIKVFDLAIEGTRAYYRSEFSSRHISNEIISYFKNKYEDLLPSILEEFNKINSSKIIEQENEKFIFNLHILYDQYSLKNSLKNKVKLIPEYNKNHDFYQLKIGINNFYSIKSVARFLRYIINESDHKYGKNLEFIHSINNFDEKAQDLIHYLLLKQDLLYDSTFIDLDDLDYFYKIKGSLILIDNIFYTLRLESLNIKIKINDKGELKMDELPSNYKVFRSNYPFLINEIDKTIDVYTDNQLINSLISLINENPYTNISNFFDEFKYKFYLSNEKYFDIDKNIISKFKKHNLIIESYIDLDDNILKISSKYIKNNIELYDLSLLNENDKYLLSFYKKIINEYGFNNGIMEDSHLIWNFLNSELNDLKEISQIYFSHSILSKKIYQFKKPGLKIKYQSNLLDIFMEDSKYSDEELLEIFASIKKKKSFILINNEFIGLENNDATSFKNEVEDFNLISNKVIEKNKELPLYYAFKNIEFLEDKNNDVIEKLYQDIKNFKSKNYEVPNVIKANLRDYQKEGYYWLKVLYKYNLGGILADDMGLGKTLEIITFIASLSISSPILIVTPTSLIYNWINEFYNFDDEKIDIIPIYGNINEREKIINKIKSNKKTIFITSYESLRNDIEKYENKEFEIIILDEAQFIKNVDALKTKSVKKIKAKNKFVLTGTPIENSIIDLWSIFDFLMPNFLPPLTEFKSNYESDENYKNEIKRKITPFILRRNKNDVLKDLPEKYEVLLTCEMNNEQQKIYDAEIFKAREKMNTSTNTFDILPTLTRLRQICIDPSLYIDKYEGGSEKINTLINCIKEELSLNNKILVFSQFVGALNIIKNRLDKEKITYGIIKGDTKSQERLKIAQDFNFNDAYDVLLVSLKAGGTGLNLIGANVVIHLDPWWNYAIEEQASDRVYRIGQTRNVKVLKLIVRDSIEQRVLELQKHKKEVANSIISNDDSSITNLKKEDILFILGKNKSN